MKRITLLVVVALGIIGSAGMGQEPPGLRTSILIAGDDQWTLENGVVGGSGSADDPYLVSGWTILGAEKAAIEIRNTTAHARIVANEISMSYVGLLEAPAAIWLRNTENVSIVQNSITLSPKAIQVDGGSDIRIEGNIVASNLPSALINYRYGMLARDMDGLTIVNNKFHDLDRGISLVRATNFTVDANEVLRTGSGGAINTFESADGAITNNTIERCIMGLGLDGLRIASLNNGIHGCWNGIFTHPMFVDGLQALDHVIAGNRLSSIDNIGLWITGCRECEVHHNEVSNARIGVYLPIEVGFENNTIRESDIAIRYNKAETVHVRNNSLLDNVVQARSEASGLLDARHNWFGVASGPNEGSMQGNVIYEPWLIAPPSGE